MTKQTLLLWLAFWACACFCHCETAAKPPSLLAAKCVCLAVMRLDGHGFANKFLIRWNYNTIFHFCGRNLQIFSKKCYKKSQKRASKAENKGWGGGLLSFCEIFWGLVWGWRFFFGFVEFLGFVWKVLRNFLGICLIFLQNFGEILNLFGNFKICWKNLNFLGNFKKSCHFER